MTGSELLWSYCVLSRHIAKTTELSRDTSKLTSNLMVLINGGRGTRGLCEVVLGVHQRRVVRTAHVVVPASIGLPVGILHGVGEVAVSHLALQVTQVQPSLAGLNIEIETSISQTVRKERMMLYCLNLLSADSITFTSKYIEALQFKQYTTLTQVHETHGMIIHSLNEKPYLKPSMM